MAPNNKIFCENVPREISYFGNMRRFSLCYRSPAIWYMNQIWLNFIVRTHNISVSASRLWNSLYARIPRRLSRIFANEVSGNIFCTHNFRLFFPVSSFISLLCNVIIFLYFSCTSIYICKYCTYKCSSHCCCDIKV